MACSLLSRVLLIMGLAALLGQTAQAADREEIAFFETRIRPLLAAKCNECHGDGAKVKGGLRLTSRQAILKGGDSGPAAVAGKPEESLLVEVLKYVDEPKMPPKGKLSDQDRGLIERWIKLGLPWPEEQAARTTSTERPAMQIGAAERSFWSFQPVRVVAPGAVAHPDEFPTTIDRYLANEIEKRQIPLSPLADRRTLLRRATFDLTGLPPTPEEVDAFLKDKSSNAFAKVVDRLLASPRYGEKWGRHWLDLVRYADSRDSRGVGGDSDILESWRYRDYVVSAFNRDLPYDRFVREQVAGDLLQPSAPDKVDVDALVATGLLTIGEWGTGDADKEKMMTDIVADQIDVVGRAFLGLTIACARCHDHKFDPIAQADYYGLAGIFFSTHILPDPGPKTNGSPMLRTPLASKAEIAAAERYRLRVAELESQLKTRSAAAAEAYAKSELTRTADYLVAAWDQTSGPASSQTLEVLARDRKLNKGVLRRWVAALGLGNVGTPLLRSIHRVRENPGVHAWAGPEDTPSVTINQNDKPVQILTFTLPPRSLNLHPAPTRPVGLVWTAPVAGPVAIQGGIKDVDPACGDGVAWVIEKRHGGLWSTLARGEIGNGASAEFAQDDRAKTLASVPIDAGDLIRLAIIPRGSHACDTTAVRWQISAKGETWDAAADLVPDLLVNGRGNPHADRKGRPDVWTAVELSENDSKVPLDKLPSFAAWKAAVARKPADRASVESAARGIAADLKAVATKPIVASLIAPGGPFRVEAGELPESALGEIKPIETELASLRAAPPAPIPVGLIAQDGGVPKSVYEGVHDSKIQIRGEYARLGKLVPRHFPVVIAGENQPRLPEKASGRKELADWLTRPDHPLTARVMVNRIWQFHFGEGLVRTSSNFGKLGERPSHPALLDYLADRFVKSGWSVKAMHREMMLSRAYQRSSTIPVEARSVDTENVWLGRMSRRRLTAEELRDALLAASGRLNLAGGGPADRDFNVPRRTLYQITIRSDRSSFGPLFDAADSAALVDKRVVSTVAPQALFLLNHPFVVQQAEGFADRLLREATTPSKRVDQAYRILFGRSPTREEAEVSLRLIDQEKGPDERTAWVAYAQVLLCTNEFMFVD